MKQIKKGKNSGYSLIEILVVIFLIGLVSTFSVGNYREFERKMVLSNLAQDVSLSIRLAQVYSVSVRNTDAGGSFEKSYGVHFDADKPTEYILFQDSDRALNGYGYSGNVADDVEIFTLSGGYFIYNVCAVIAGGAREDCSEARNLDYFDILFDRPDPDSIFNGNAGDSYESATIMIQDISGNNKTIQVYATGFIDVN